MSDEITIEDFLGQDLEYDRVVLRGKILSNFENRRFNFADTTKCVIVKADNSYIGGYEIASGNYIKLINPERDDDDLNGLVMTKKTKIIPTRRIKALADLEAKQSKTFTTVQAAGNLDPYQVLSYYLFKKAKYLVIFMFNFRKCLRSESRC